MLICEKCCSANRIAPHIHLDYSFEGPCGVCKEVGFCGKDTFLIEQGYLPSKTPLRPYKDVDRETMEILLSRFANRLIDDDGVLTKENLLILEAEACKALHFARHNGFLDVGTLGQRYKEEKPRD